MNLGRAVSQGITEPPRVLGQREATDKTDRRDPSDRTGPIGLRGQNGLRSSPDHRIDDPRKDPQGILTARWRETGPLGLNHHHGGMNMQAKIATTGPRGTAEVVGLIATMIVDPLHESRTWQHPHPRVRRRGPWSQLIQRGPSYRKKIAPRS